jgi:hypothetical protein
MFRCVCVCTEATLGQEDQSSSRWLDANHSGTYQFPKGTGGLAPHPSGLFAHFVHTCDSKLTYAMFLPTPSRTG